MGELSNFTGGALPWMRDRLRALNASRGSSSISIRSSSSSSSSSSEGSVTDVAVAPTPVQALPKAQDVVLVIHQPFRCRDGVPDWYFCFSDDDKMTLRSAFEEDLGGQVDLLWGVMAGHQHRCVLRACCALSSAAAADCFCSRCCWCCWCCWCCCCRCCCSCCCRCCRRRRRRCCFYSGLRTLLVLVQVLLARGVASRLYCSL
jgi:hypothetical protein